MSPQTHHHKPIFKGANSILFNDLFSSRHFDLVSACACRTPIWQLLAVIIGLLIGLIDKAMPMGGISFLALTVLSDGGYLILTVLVLDKFPLFNGFCLH